VNLPFFIIGHSNRSLEEFVKLLGSADIGLVADIRTVPSLRANPQFNKDALPGALAAFRVSYDHVAALGGLRGKARTVSQEVNGFWTNESFHNYADYALSAHLHGGLEHLLKQGQASLRDNVLGGCMVEVPSAHCCRSSYRPGRNSFPHYGPL
jgi:uncharacterized protein (DUF488 family)